MKKFIALLLAAMLMLTAVSAFAESEKDTIPYDESMHFAVVYPEGYEVTVDVDEGYVLCYMLAADESAVNMLMIVAPDNELEDIATINDLSEEEKAELAEGLIEDLYNPTWEIRTTGLGTEVIVIDEQGAEDDLVTLTALYHGYVVTMYLGHNDGSTVTEEDIALGLQFFTDMDFVSTVE